LFVSCFDCLFHRLCEINQILLIMVDVKFQEYETYPCAFVLYNNNAALVDVTKPELVLGAMYGNVGIVIPFNVETAEPTGHEYQAFLEGGKMIRPHWKEAANTRISALITLRFVEVGPMQQNEFGSKIKSRETKLVKRAADVLPTANQRELRI
jgi:hypothetical protein